MHALFSSFRAQSYNHHPTSSNKHSNTKLPCPPFSQDQLVSPQFVMHSSQVRDVDFAVVDGGRLLDNLQSFLPTVNCLTRVGVVAPCTGTEAAGAATLILAMITAFYDDLRATSPEGFFAYPDFFVFQPAGRSKPAPYSMFGAQRLSLDCLALHWLHCGSRWP